MNITIAQKNDEYLKYHTNVFCEINYDSIKNSQILGNKIIWYIYSNLILASIDLQSKKWTIIKNIKGHNMKSFENIEILKVLFLECNNIIK